MPASLAMVEHHQSLCFGAPGSRIGAGVRLSGATYSSVGSSWRTWRRIAAHRPVVQSVQRRDHRHLGWIPRDHTSPTCRQFGEADLEALDELAVEAEFDGAGTGE